MKMKWVWGENTAEFRMLKNGNLEATGLGIKVPDWEHAGACYGVFTPSVL